MLALHAFFDARKYRAVGSLTIRNLADEVLAALKRRSAQAGHSTEEEARRILSEAVDPGRRSYWARMEERRSSYGRRVFSSSTDLVREGRDERARRRGGS